MFVCTTCLPGAHGSQKWDLDPLELEQLGVVSQLWLARVP